MKKIYFAFILFLSTTLVLSSCSSLNNTAKGGILGGSGGAVLGAAAGALLGKDAKSAAIGAAIGTAVGATTGVIIGKKMDKAAAAAAAIQNAQVDTVTDSNGLKAVKVTFDSGILFATNKSTLSSAAKTALTKFAAVLLANPTMDVSIEGHTDNTGSLELNQKLSEDRAQAVAKYLMNQGVPSSQITNVVGLNYSVPVADNSTAAGRAKNRRVEIYMYASAAMIKAAQAEVNK